MTKPLVFFSCCLIFSNVFSQGDGKRFFTIEGAETDSLHSYYYQRMVEVEKDRYKTESYYSRTGTIRHDEEPTDEKGVFIRTYFFPNGKVKAKGIFNSSIPSGSLNAFYSNGTNHAELLFEHERENPLEISITVGIINYWDSLGNKIVNEGTGFCNCWLEPYDDYVVLESGEVRNGLKEGNWKGIDKMHNASFEEVYKNGKLVSGEQVREGITYSYNKVQQMAVPKEGMVGFYKYVGSIIRYPRVARRNGIEGRVFVEFIVDEEGNVSNCEILKGISKECNDEALRVIKSSPRWNNGTYRGKPVKQRMVLPLTFRLG